MIELKNLTKSFLVKGQGERRRKRVMHAVKDVEFQWGTQEFVAIVGESGCGKSTLGRVIAGIMPPSEGDVLLDGNSTLKLNKQQRREWARVVQLIPQDPFAALNPVRKISSLFADPLRYHGIATGSRVKQRTAELLDLVGLEPSNVMNKYPHQLSGGQRQRIVVARALTVNPRYLIADESVSMVDVSLRIGIMDKMKAIARERELGLLFITHDFRVARYIAQNGRIAVMYLGRIVEIGPTEEVLQNPQHPYTQALISAVPVLEGREQRVTLIEPRNYELTSEVSHEGCAFEPRCPFATESCRTKSPDLLEVSKSHGVACHYATPRRMVERENNAMV